MLVDSHDGERLPELIGNYVESLASGKKHWSTVHEIRTWINDTHVTGPLSDRECRALRRHASLANATNGATALGAAEGNINASQADDEDVRSLMSNSGSAYVLENVLQRAAMPGYQVSYGESKSKDSIHVWEPSSVVPRKAVERWEQSRIGFKYSAEELDLMKLCAGSLKQNQAAQVFTNAGVFATIMNCGIIVSLTNLVGAESLTQVFMHVEELYHSHGDLPAEFGYDDGCHLRKFADLHKDVNDRARSFWDRVGQFIFVDRFHWRNHKGSHKYCTDHCNPDHNRRIDGANTKICEQSFRWFARHKYSVNHMTPGRFTFFFLILAERRNEILLSKRKSKQKA